MNVVGVSTLSALSADSELTSTLSGISFQTVKPSDVGSSGGGGQGGGYTPFNSTVPPGKFLCADENGIKVSDSDCGNSTALKLGSSGSNGTICLNTADGWTNTGCNEFSWGSDPSCSSGASNSFGQTPVGTAATCSLRIGGNGMDMKIEFDGSVFTLQEIQTN